MEFLRDLVIVIAGFLIIIFLIVFAILGLVLYAKARSLMKEAKKVIEKSGSSARMKQTVLIIQGLAAILTAVANALKKRKGD